MKTLPSNPPPESDAGADAYFAGQRRLLSLQLWENSCVPIRHRSFSVPASGPWLDALEDMRPRLGQGFLFVVIGIRGTGKTQLGTELIRECCRVGRSGVYIKALDIFMAIRESYKADKVTEAQVVKRFTQPKLLVIDALEERGETPFEDRVLNHIIDLRYDGMGDTLLITNQDEKAFSNSMGPSIVSRIHETGGKVVCTWKSFRERG